MGSDLEGTSVARLTEDGGWECLKWAIFTVVPIANKHASNIPWIYRNARTPMECK